MDILLPLYLIQRVIPCWKCGKSMKAISFLASVQEGDEIEVCSISNVTELSEEIAAFAEAHSPDFFKSHSKTADFSYYANHCPHCKIITGDFHLHSEPGGAFFPNDEEEASNISLQEVPCQPTFLIEGGIHYGMGEIILKNAQRI